MIENLEAVNAYVLVIRDEAEETIGELFLPDQAKIKPATGRIISVGKLVPDDTIKVDRKAVFNKNNGFDIEIGGEVITVLYAGADSSHVLAVI